MMNMIDVASVEAGGRTRSSALASPDRGALGIATQAIPQPGRPGELPWRVVAKDNALALHLIRLREEGLSDAANAPILMGCGGALENLRLALNHAGYDHEVSIFPNDAQGAPVATICAGEARVPGREEDALYSIVMEPELEGSLASPDTRCVSPTLLALLHHAAQTRGSWIEEIADDCRRAMLGDLVAQAASLSDAARGSRQLISLFGADTFLPVMFGDYDRLGLEHLFGALGASVRPTSALPRSPRQWKGASIVEAPLVMVLGSAADGPTDWLNAGAALQRVLLHATAQRMTATFFAEPIRHPLVREQLRSMLFAGGQPHAIIRFDFAGTAM